MSFPIILLPITIILLLFFRCADKILTQLEIHADAVLAQNTNNVTNKNAKLSSLKNHVDPVSYCNFAIKFYCNFFISLQFATL